jgi:riboflavin kinase/FMN adenylyltransferase
MLPIAGVFAVRAILEPGGDARPGLLNVGSAPTFPGKVAAPHQAELHLLDFKADLYGRRLSVRPMAFIREERRFASAIELHEQIRLDAAAARQILARRD